MRGDSESATTVPCVSAPDPVVTIFSTSRLDRSGEMISQASPFRVRRMTWLPPRYRTSGSCFDSSSGLFQLKRKAGIPSFGKGRMYLMRLVERLIRPAYAC